MIEGYNEIVPACTSLIFVSLAGAILSTLCLHKWRQKWRQK